MVMNNESSDKHIPMKGTRMRQLTSVVVISYNSAKTIEETLESVAAQTYSPLELIVSDDASTDDTAATARAWIEKNRSRFVRAEVVVAEKNGGVSANCNRGISAARGEYLKSIAADDLLLPECIEKNIKFIEENPEAQVVFSEIKRFSGSPKNRIFHGSYPDEENRSYFSKPAHEQFRGLVTEKFWGIPAPSLFAKTEILRDVFPYDEKYRFMEDFPEWCRLSRAGIKFYFFPEATVLYRVNSDSISSENKKTFYPLRLWETRRLFFLLEWRDYLLELGLPEEAKRRERDFLIFDFLRLVFKNRRTAAASLFRHILSRFLKAFLR